jgi:hypothetical protein
MAFINQRGELKTGCGVLFALPFLAAGIGMTCWTAWLAMRHTAMQSWPEVPAKILDTKFQGGSDSHRATTEYEYQYSGRTYRGERVGLLEISDNFGDFQRRVYDELKRHQQEGTPFRAFVNPHNPGQSILYRQLRWEFMSFFTIFATIFGGAGVGMVVGAIASARRGPADGPTSFSPDEPWKARSDWASGRILDAGSASVAAPVLAAVAVWWLIGSAPLTSKLVGMLQASDSPWRWVALAFPVVGSLLILVAAYQFARRRKYGESVLQLAATPGIVGGQLGGVVRIPRAIRADGGFRLMLSCIERRTARRDDHTHEDVLWQDERVVTEPIRDIAAGAIAVPVLFAIPYEAEETSRAESNRCIFWRLDVAAKTPGVDYKSRFDVPVYKTADSRPDFKLDAGLLADYVASPPRDLVLRDAGIIKEPLPGEGVRLTFPASRNWGAALVVTGFLAFWSAAIWAMLHFSVPIVFPIVFGLIELVVIWLASDLWFYRSVVEARKDGLTCRGGLLGIGRRRSWTADEVKRFTTRESMSSGHQVWKHIEVVPKKGKKRTLAQTINGKLAQEAVIDELNEALGR